VGVCLKESARCRGTDWVTDSAADPVGLAWKPKSSMKMILCIVLESVRVAILCIVMVGSDGSRMVMTLLGQSVASFRLTKHAAKVENSRGCFASAKSCVMDEVLAHDSSAWGNQVRRNLILGCYVLVLWQVTDGLRGTCRKTST